MACWVDTFPWLGVGEMACRCYGEKGDESEGEEGNLCDLSQGNSESYGDKCWLSYWST